ncbi:MAG: dihydropteroate synthase [Planctomycetota bacterium]|jgi:5-methyltetrahydrofolate corrinoid/iron sulfur protein methyltransferase
MLIIGERINGMFKKMGAAIAAKEKGPIQQMALKQIEAGAGMLDVNVGTAAEDKLGAMQWLVETIQEVTDKPLAIDSSNPEVVEAGLKVCSSHALINSTTAEDAKLETLLGLAVEYKADILGLTLDENGIPSTKDERVMLGAKILMMAMEMGMEATQVYLDPVALPVKFAQEGNQTVAMLEVMRDLKQLNDPAPLTTLGLSNISNGCMKNMRSLVNRTYLVMCLTCGLDSAITDPFDTDLVEAMIATELLLCKAIYADDFIKAYRASH